jgi:hypothetical protein
MATPSAIAQARQQEYVLRLRVNRLRQQVREQPGASEALRKQLAKGEQALGEIETKLADLQQKQVAAAASGPAPEAKLPETGSIVDTHKENHYLGADTTGLDVQVNLRMPYVPTAIYHLLDRSDTPLISCRVRNGKKEDVTLRVRVISFIEHYSARAVETVELKKGDPWLFDQLPTLLPDRVRDLNEMTRATLNIMVENLDGKVELHKTEPIWLLARTTALLDYWDPTTQQTRDLTPYLGAFVTPNAPDVMSFVRGAAAAAPGGEFISYFGDEKTVEEQVKAIFEALKGNKLTYVNSWVSFGPDRRSQFHQRVRLPRESLKDRQANCIDGTVLFASLLEAVSLSAAIVLVPGHAFVAWETKCDINGNGNSDWRYLETTMIGSDTFENACKSAKQTYQDNGAKAQLLPLRELRSQGISPLE